ncbi:MAG: pilus assembly protein CpaF [Actinomycetota bacterium]|nr:pilus assembly protein CpaF [Actinomycetota bacterium]
MSLADRLAAARLAQYPPDAAGTGGVRDSAGRDVTGRDVTGRSSGPLAEVRRQVHHDLLEAVGPELYDARLSQADLEQRVRQSLQGVLAPGSVPPLTAADRARLEEEIADDILGYGPIEPYLRDAEVTEIMVNGPGRIFVERGGLLYPVDGRFADEQHLRRTIDKIVGRVGRRVDEASPMVDARLPDGSRVNAIIPPLAVDGSLLTIRKFSAVPLTTDDLVTFGTLTRQVADFLAACVRGRLNILVSGGTGAGKTTTLNVLSSYIPANERVVTVEDAAELQLYQEHVLRLESRPPNIEGRGEVRIRDLVRNALRMRPDRIVVGEIRDAAALDMLQAMNTGHDGSICTVHANSPRDVLSRVETMVMMSGMDLPITAIREQISSALDLVVHQARFQDGSRRITHVTEVAGMEGQVISTQDLFVFDHRGGFDAHGRALGSLCSTGLRPTFSPQLAALGIALDPSLFGFGRYGD